MELKLCYHIFFIFLPDPRKCFTLSSMWWSQTQKYQQYVQKNKYLFYSRAHLEHINCIIFRHYNFCPHLHGLIPLQMKEINMIGLEFAFKAHFFQFLLYFAYPFPLLSIFYVHFTFASLKMEYKWSVTHLHIWSVVLNICSCTNDYVGRNVKEN